MCIDTYNFETLAEDILKSPLKISLSTKSPRELAFGIQSQMGTISSLFLSKTEKECTLGLIGWSSNDIQVLAASVASICILLSCLSKLASRTLSMCISDKFVKNANKYPAALVKGSSAKYTAYVSKIKDQQDKVSFSLSFVAAACLITGCLGFIVGNTTLFRVFTNIRK
jgi:hypothetical protein